MISAGKHVFGCPISTGAVIADVPEMKEISYLSVIENNPGERGTPERPVGERDCGQLRHVRAGPYVRLVPVQRQIRFGPVFRPDDAHVPGGFQGRP